MTVVIRPVAIKQCLIGPAITKLSAGDLGAGQSIQRGSGPGLCSNALAFANASANAAFAFALALDSFAADAFALAFAFDSSAFAFALAFDSNAFD